MIDASRIDNINTVATKSGKAQTNLDQTFNDFLLLLTTQLENQDPTSPMETNEITQQIASMSSVQEQINTNKNLETLISIVGGSQLNNVVSYIGRVVEAAGNETLLMSNGEQQGAVFLYDLPTEAKSTIINISDSTGKLVYSGPALTKAGRNEVIWEGQNSFTGQIMPPGEYSFSITAKDFNGGNIEAKTFTTGIVTSVDSYNDTVSLSLGTIKINLQDITAIKSAQELL